MTTSISPNPTLAHPLAAAAQTQAQAAALAARVIVREPDGPAELGALAALFARVWEVEPGQTVLPSELMRVMAYEGCYVSGAFDETDGGRLIGGCVGFFGVDEDAPADRWRRIHLHSHIAAVVPTAAGRHAGYALKLHQRAWALRQGIDRITWTFDPLVRGNAYFNLAKLAARASRYLVDFYGDMPDGVNAGHGSDRLLVDWALASPQAVAAADGDRPEPREIAPLVEARRVLLSGLVLDEMPSVRPLPEGTGPWLAGTPSGIHALRHWMPERALAWRYALREALTEALDRDYRITGFTRSGWYLLEHPASAEYAARHTEEAEQS